MKVWIAEISDFLPEIDKGNRLYRAGMLANALVENGHFVKWWSSTFNHQQRKQRYHLSKTIDIKANYQLRLLYGPGYKKSVSLNRVRHNRVVATEFANEINQTSDNEKPNIIYACLPTLEVCEQAVFFGEKHHIPVVIDIRELLPDNYLTVFPKQFRSLIRLVIRSEFNRAYRILHNATAIAASSPAYLEWGIKTGNRVGRNHDRWFPLGGKLNTQVHRHPKTNGPVRLPDGTLLPQDYLLITFIGTFTSHVDYATLVSVAREFHLAGQNKVHFLFAGNGDKFEYFKNLTKGLDNFHLPGWCEKEAIDQILSISSVGIAPYMMEIKPTLPNKPFEYMSAGLPILSTLDGDLKSILKNESIGVQYSAGSSEDLKEKIQWFLENPSETKAMGRRAKILFEKQYAENLVYKNFTEYLCMLSKK